MVGACHRRTGNLHQAYSSYSTALDRFPDSEECVRHLIRLSIDLRLQRQHSEWVERLQRMQKSRQIREKRAQSAYRQSNGNSSYFGVFRSFPVNLREVSASPKTIEAIETQKALLFEIFPF
jgi:hypothetical protein